VVQAIKSSPSVASATSRPSSPVGAVVVGGDYQGLGIVRSLGRRGIPVFVVDDEFSISRFSKYCTRFLHVAGLRDERTAIDALLRFGKEFDLGGWVLYPTREETVASFSRHRLDLERIFRVPTPEWSSIQWAWDKRNTYSLAGELGIPTPRTFCLESVEQLADLDSLEPPFAIKPAIKEHFFYATKAKAWLANSHAELRSLFLKASKVIAPNEILIQEVIPGGGMQQFAYCAFFRNGQTVGSLVARRQRQHPLQFGRASTYVETIDAPILEEYSTRFLSASDYYGLAEVEYKLDPRDGRYKLLDVNARTWGYHSIGARAGVDFSYMLYADQVGDAVAESRGEPGIGWMRLTTDLPAAFAAWRKGDTSLRSYFKSVANCNVEAVFSRDDPMPGVAEVILVPYLAFKRGY
jgi:D-aspartate ligase